MTHFDLVVLGSGPAGEKGAAQAAYFGKKVALVEKESVLGGAAVNTGTLPSKTFRETALYLSGYRQRGLFGVDLQLRRAATSSDFLRRKDIVVREERERIAINLENHGIERLRGEASFVDAHTLAIRSGAGVEKHITGDFVLVATGSSPVRPAGYAFDHRRIFDSDEIAGLTELPRALAIVGGGVIGCEYACLFATMGVQVTLIDGRQTLLSFLDGEFSKALMQRMRQLDIELVLGRKVERCDVDDNAVRLVLDDGATLVADDCLVCAGRSGNTAALNLKAVGLSPGPRGDLGVNERYQTAVPNIYAAGDVVGFPALASTAMEQARIAVVHAFGFEYKTSLAPILPYGIYTIPEVSMAGETEESLATKGVPYVAGVASFGDNARGRIIGDVSGKVKLLFRRSDMRLLGVHVLGENATELVHVGLTALLCEATADLFVRMCFNYPTLSEAYKYATYDALGKVASSG